MFSVLMDRRSMLRGAAASMAVLRAACVRAQSKPEKTRVRVAVGAKSSFQNLPLVIAERLGYFLTEGLQVEIQEFGHDDRATQALVEARSDVVCGAFEQVIDLQGRRLFCRAFVLMGRAPQVAFGVSTRTMPSYRRVSDLRGRRIGVSMAGESTRLVASLVLARDGVLPNEVNFVEFASVNEAVAGVRGGRVDAISHCEPVMTMLEKKGDTRIVSDTRSLKGALELFGGPMPAACMFAPDEFVDRNQGTVQALTNGVVHALKWLQTAGLSDLIKVVPEPYLMGDRGLYLASFGKVRDAFAIDGLIPEDGVKTALQVWGRVGTSVQPSKVDLARTFSNTYARKAKDLFRA